MLGGKPWMPGPVLDASLSALELGVRIGMPLAAAHRMAPEAIFLEPDREADEAALRAALELLGGLSPGLVAETEADAPGFGRIEIQLDGLERLWGPETQIVERAASLLAGMLPGDAAGGNWRDAVRGGGGGRRGRPGAPTEYREARLAREVETRSSPMSASSRAPMPRFSRRCPRRC